MEQCAQGKGITNYHLETTSFQALPFYQKQGYEVFGQLPDMPPGHISYFLKKQIFRALFKFNVVTNMDDMILI
jgi:hypothetical protein